MNDQPVKRKIRKWLLTALAVSLYALSFTIAVASYYLFIQPIDVIQDWHISVAPGTYHVGDVLTVDTTAKKVGDYQGISSRYLECKKDSENVYTSYKLEEQPTYHPKGGVIRNQFTVLIPGITAVPARCYFFIRVDYRINKFRNFTETARSSNDFELLPAEPPKVQTVVNTCAAPPDLTYQPPSESSTTKPPTPAASSPAKPAPNPNIPAGPLQTVMNIFRALGL